MKNKVDLIREYLESTDIEIYELIERNALAPLCQLLDAYVLQSIEHKSNVYLKNATPHEDKPLLHAAFFQKYGFSNPIRYWNEKRQQFSIYYKIRGYDCDILVSPITQVAPNSCNAYGEGVHEMPPEIQVDEFSDVKILENHHTGDFQIFVNSFENHIATFHYEFQMLDFMSICECPLSYTYKK